MPRNNTSKPKKTAKAKAGKLNSLSQTHGKTDKKPTPTTLDQIWGDDGVWKYNTMDAEIYSRQLDEYNLTDLQKHASRVGIIPIESRPRLQETLLKEFKKHVSAYNVPNDPTQQKMEDLNPEAIKILKEGR